MVAVAGIRCDTCGKLQEVPPAEILKGWRRMPLPFRSTKVVDVCSPGCAKRAANDDIDAEWGGETTTVEPEPRLLDQAVRVR